MNSNLLQQLSNFTAAAVDRASAAIVAISGRRSTLTSGVHWREGLIVTANHAVRREGEITALLPDGRTASATLIGRDPSTDLALLKLSEAGIGLPSMGDPAALKVGNLVLAVGRVETGPRASLGVVGVLGGPWETWQGGRIDQLIRLGFDLHPTLSGGLLVDLEGQCLGVNTRGLSRTLGVCIPAVTVNRVIELLLQKGRIPQGYLGVGVWPVAIPSELQAKFALSESRGLMIQHVEPDSPAAKAGLLMGDVLVRLDSNPITGIDRLHRLLSAEMMGGSVKASVIRAGTLTEFNVLIEERPN